MATLTRKRNSAFLFGVSLSLLAVVHIPSRIWPGTFDRNAAPQFILLLILGIGASISWGAERKIVASKPLLISLLILVASSSISLILSDSFFTSLLGDTGRYTGFASLLALIAIASVAFLIDESEWRNLFIGISISLTLIPILGALQVFNVISLPTGGGAGSTLGNLDFLSAWIGTTVLLFLCTLANYKYRAPIFSLYLLLNLLVLWKIGAKQGFLDVLITAIVIAFYYVFKKLRIREISANTWKVILTFLILLWSEAIFLIPMAKIPFPGISGDVQVSIRADFWLSAARIFSEHLAFGVGPDNYGNYYEKFRSLNSVKETEFVLANDAHSSMMQTLSTLGIFASLAFLVLILLVFFAGIDLYKHTGDKRYLLLLLSFFVFYTNSLISPITLPHKALFWVIGGILLGARMRMRELACSKLQTVKSPLIASVMAVVLVIALTVFLPSFVKVNRALSRDFEGKNHEYVVSSSLPCVAFADAQLALTAKSGGNVVLAADAIARNHPRCLSALSVIAENLIRSKNYETARPYIYQLLDVAPARHSVVRLAAIYAMAAGDENLKSLLTSQGLKLGILTESTQK